MGFWRASSGRLTFDLPGVAATDYSAVCRGIADALGLAPARDNIIGSEQMFRDFRRRNQVVGLDWDIWMEFMAVAKTEASEPPLRDVAVWLSSSRWPGAGKQAELGSAPDPARSSSS